MSSNAGRPSDLTDELLIEIKQLTLDGKNLKEIASIKEIPEVTIYKWHEKNYLNFYDKVEGWRRDRKLMLANRNIEAILQLDTNDKDFVKTVSDMSKFVAETLDKKNYSKRTENTGADGKDLMPTPLLAYVFNNNGNQKDNQSQEAIENSAGGDISEQVNLDTLIPDTSSSE